MCLLTSCDLSMLPGMRQKEDVITVEYGYLVVNGVMTEYKVDTEDIITVEDGYLVVNGVKTEHKVDAGGGVTDNKDDGKDNSVTGDDNTDKDHANEKDDKDEADVITVEDGPGAWCS